MTTTTLWKSLLKTTVTTKDGRVEDLHILQGPTYPCMFYAGPIFDTECTPRFNGTPYYHRTQEEALNAILRMSGTPET